MRTIRIISGVYGHRPAGSKFVEPKRAGDLPFLVEDEQAARLVALKVAVYADEDKNLDDTGVATAVAGRKDDSAVDNLPPEDVPSKGEIAAPGKPVYSADMKVAELREIMEDCGLTYKVGMSKADLVAALDDYFADDETAEDDEDELPDIGAEEPVV